MSVLVPAGFEHVPKCKPCAGRGVEVMAFMVLLNLQTGEADTPMCPACVRATIAIMDALASASTKLSEE